MFRGGVEVFVFSRKKKNLDTPTDREHMSRMFAIWVMQSHKDSFSNNRLKQGKKFACRY